MQDYRRGRPTCADIAPRPHWLQTTQYSPSLSIVAGKMHSINNEQTT